MYSILLPFALVISNTSAAYDKFKIAFTAKQYDRARLHAKVACDGGIFDGCYSLGMMLVNGLGGAVDIPQGRVYLHKACRGGLIGACYSFNSTMMPR
jgi:TPR repeat protein